MVVSVIKNGLRQAWLTLKGRRVIVIHNHIFKNAGTTIDGALHKNFGEAFIDHRDDASMRKGASYLGPYLTKNKQIKALSTHHLTMPLPSLVNVELKELMMFRHPIERVTSVYNFERQQIIDIPGTIHARKLSLKDYIIWRMRPEVGATIRNYHVRKMLAPRKPGQESVRNHEMAELKQRLSNMEMFGLVERFDESMVFFEDCLTKFFLKIDLSYVPQNVGQAPGEGLSTKIERLKEEIGDDVFDLLIKKNQYDLQLYEWVKDLFENRIETDRAFGEKLVKFRSRCAELMK